MKENAWFIIIFSAMLLTVLILNGCTQFDKRTAQEKSWKVRVQSTVEGECIATVDAYHDNEVTDDTVTVENPSGD